MERLKAAESRAVIFPISAVFVGEAAKEPVEHEKMSCAEGLEKEPILEGELVCATAYCNVSWLAGSRV